MGELKLRTKSGRALVKVMVSLPASVVEELRREVDELDTTMPEVVRRRLARSLKYDSAPPRFEENGSARDARAA